MSVAIDFKPLPITEVVQIKKANYEKAQQERCKISFQEKVFNGLGEGVMVVGDMGSIAFSVMEGAGYVLSHVPAPLLLVGSIGGIIGGGLCMAEGVYVLALAMRHYQGGRTEESLKLALTGLLLLGRGLTIFLASITALGVQMGALSNPYTTTLILAIFLVGLVLPVLGQTSGYIYRRCTDRDDASQILRMNLQQLQDLARQLNFEQASQRLEQISDRMGVDTAIALMELVAECTNVTTLQQLSAKVEACRRAVRTFDRNKAVNTLQQLLMLASLPLGLGVSDSLAQLAIAGASAIGFKQDLLNPFNGRNGPLSVDPAVQPIRVQSAV